MGSDARVDSVRVLVRPALMSIGVSASILMPSVGTGASCALVLGRDKGCEVCGVLILWCVAA